MDNDNNNSCYTPDGIEAKEVLKTLRIRRHRMLFTHKQARFSVWDTPNMELNYTAIIVYNIPRQ
jgi:hypothetical protein